MDNIDKKIKDIISAELTPHKSFDETIYKTFDNIKSKEKIKIRYFKYILATACCSTILITGVVFAKDIQNFIGEQFRDFGLGEGISTAVENGYVGKSDNEDLQNVQIIENNKATDTINMKTKINEFIMSDTKLSLDFSFEFEDKINKYIDLVKTEEENIDYENSFGIELLDLFIIDDENRLVFYNYDYYKYNSKDNELFTKYCKENNIDYKDMQNDIFGKSNITKEYYNITDYIGLNNIYTFVSKNDFPHSKELNIYFSKMQLFSKKENKDVILQGDWKIHLDIPENMLNRSVDSYEIVTCDNKNFNLYEAKLTDTDFKIGIEISNIEKPIYPEKLLQIENDISKANGGEYSMSCNTKEDVAKFYGGTEYADLWEEYQLKYYLIGDAINFMLPWIKEDRQCYVENSDGEKFRLIAETLDCFKEGNKYDYRATCDMNKYTASDEIKIVIVMNGKPYEIKLKRID